MPNHRLLAWIEPKEDHYTAALVAAAAQHRAWLRCCSTTPIKRLAKHCVQSVWRRRSGHRLRFTNRQLDWSSTG